ncbi:MAG: acetyl-CoA carboxylase biotin carboxyl carrier protein [Phycisphaerales bacterium]|nr:acetyl-CoA carboxylase biotin carboxyl carrier protein [Planctomycetota bacterium]MCH8509849.1 acetyl-CoA carboxylase biotin carboxyl carrier protein [Phycisphaerales bacterium]
MIDIRKLKELVRLMVENELSELDLRDEQETVTIKRGGPGPAYIAAPGMGQMGQMMPAPAARPAADDAGDNGSAETGDDPSLVAIESPMVGTYYSRPNPDTDCFVKPGANIGPDTVVCLVEAMKVFNEIKAEVSGTIEKILVKDGDSVEFGQKLFLVRPN